MGKQSRISRRLNTRTTPSQRGRTGLDPRVKLGIAAGLVVGLAVVLTAAAFAFAVSLRPADSGSPPQGTQVFAENDHTHVTGSVTYDRVPPAGGAHNPTQLNCGVYSQPVPNENAVHSLEHGAVWITYRPTLPADQVASLQQFVTSHYVGTQRYLILSPFRRPAFAHRRQRLGRAARRRLSFGLAAGPIREGLRWGRPGRRARRCVHRRGRQPSRVICQTKKEPAARTGRRFCFR